MLSQFKEKELERITKLVGDYQQDIVALEEEAKGIDEKYRQLAEKEKADISSTIEYILNLMEDLKAKVLILGGDGTVPEKKPRKKREKKEEPAEPSAAPADSEVVVDTLFPENNEPEPETVAEEPVTITEEEVVTEEQPAEDFPEDDWGEPKDTYTEDKPLDLDSWDIPEEWK